MSHISALDGQRDQPVTRGSPLYFERENIITGKTPPIFGFLYEKLSHKDKKKNMPLLSVTSERRPSTDGVLLGRFELSEKKQNRKNYWLLVCVRVIVLIYMYRV